MYIIIEKMEDFFIDNQPTPPQATLVHEQPHIQEEHPQPGISQQYQQAFEFNYSQNEPQPQAFLHSQEENQFNDFQEDETARRIRQEQERIQASLKEKSDRQWSDKQKRREEGRRQLEEYTAKKEEEKVQRAQDNIRKQAELKEQHAKLNVQAGWKKVTINVNMRQGQRAGSKDTNRMREAILHRREDDKR